MKIKHIIRIVLVIFIFVPMLIMLIAIRGTSQHYTMETIKEGLELTVKGEADNISADISKFKLDLKLISDNGAYKDIMHDRRHGNKIDSNKEQQVHQYLEYVTQKSDSVLEASLLDTDGKVIYSSDKDIVGSIYGIPDDLVFSEKDSVYIGHSQDYLNFMMKTFDGNDLIGYAEVKVKLSDVHYPLLTQNVSGAKSFILWDDNVIFDYKDGDIAISDLEDDGFKKFLTETYEGNLKTHECSEGKIIAYSAKIAGSSHWFVGMVDSRGMHGHTTQVLKRTLLLTLPLFIVLSVLSFVIADVVIKPFNRLIDIMKRIRMGDRSARFDISGGGEISKIGNEFNMLIDEVVRSEERHKVISGISDSMLFDWNARTQRMYISDNLSEKFSISKELADERGILAFSECIHEDDFDKFYEDIQLAIQKENGIESQYRFNLATGDYIWTSLKAMCITDWTGEPTHLIGVLHDIDADKRKELILSERATYDYLSQLYNRESFEKKLGAQLDSAMKNQLSIAILFIDLDDFKDINDNYSHAVGDEVLKFVADTIKSKITGKGFAGRFGGDEFVVCITDNESVENVEEFATGIIDSLNEGFYSESGNHFKVECSIGIAISPDHGRAIPELFMAADDAMYHVKKDGKGNYHLYDQDKNNFSN